LEAGAQNNIIFSGRIFDNVTNQPLPFVTVEIRKSGTGVITNEFGEFKYHIPQGFENDKVQITSIGYKKIQLNVSEIESEVLTIYKLDPVVQQLPEVEIKAIKGTPAIVIVNRAIRNIRKNYPNEKTLLYGYYRDYISPISKNNYKNLTEAAIIIEDKGFNRNDYERTKIMLEQLRFNPEIEIDSSLNMGYDGKNKYIPNANIKGKNELSILRMHDPIRNHAIKTFSFVDIFDSQFAYNHKFTYESITPVDSYTIYCINFETHKQNFLSTSEYWVKGQIYIQSKTYAILKFNYSVDCSLPSYKGKFFDLKLEYKNFNDKYYLNYLSLMNYFEFKNPTSADSVSTNAESYYQFRELFINKIVNKPFESLQPEETLNKDSSLLINKVPVQVGFWDNYNYTSHVNLLQ